MGKLVLFMHTSLDGFVAGPTGEMDWIRVDEEIFDYAGARTNEADTALYGRVTFEMMDAYWPTAADQPNASKHDIEHAAWYTNVHKLVLSNTLSGEDLTNTTIVRSNLAEAINNRKQVTDKDIIIFGSPGAAHSLMAENLIDDYWLFVNPILLGQGIPLFDQIQNRISLNLIASKTFANGVVCLHYQRA